MNGKVKEVLEGARELIINKGWTQGYYARDKFGDCTGTFSPDATCFCSLGAIQKACDTVEVWCAKPIGVLSKLIGGLPIEEWNDDPTRTKAEVVALFDKAISSLEDVTP